MSFLIDWLRVSLHKWLHEFTANVNYRWLDISLIQYIVLLTTQETPQSIAQFGKSTLYRCFPSNMTSLPGGWPHWGSGVCQISDLFACLFLVFQTKVFQIINLLHCIIVFPPNWLKLAKFCFWWPEIRHFSSL